MVDSIEMEAGARTCSILSGIPLNDVKRLRKKINKVLLSLKDPFDKLEEACKDEKVQYSDIIVKSFYYAIMSYLSADARIDIVGEVLHGMACDVCNNKDCDNDNRNIFEELRNKEIDEVMKNRGKNRIRTTKRTV